MSAVGGEAVRNTGFRLSNEFLEDVLKQERGYAVGPERALLSALLFDGIQNYMNYALATSEKVSRRYKEAYNWVHSEERDYIFAFECVCEALGIDSEYIRVGLSNVVNSRLEGWKKRRRTF